MRGILMMILLSASWAIAAESQWVHFDEKKNLVYKKLETGERILDFSYAGYGGGGVAIPNVSVKKTVGPSGEDDTEAIQKAIDEVSEMELGNGERGAVLLKPGTFNCSRTIAIKSTGVVLRGSGSGEGGTVIRLTGRPHVCVSVKGAGSPQPMGQEVKITDRYISSGSDSFSVADASSFQQGQTILIIRPVTESWVHFMGMDTLVRNGRKETWISGQTQTERRIKSIANNQIILDIPMTDSFDAKYLDPPGASVVHASEGGRISQVGLENFRISAPGESVPINVPLYRAFSMDHVVDGWARDIAIENTHNSVSLGGGTMRMTVENVRITHNAATQGAAKPADFSGGGTQLLFERCTSQGNNLFYFMTGPRISGPIVVKDCIFKGDGHVQPHARWATGLLVENTQVPEGGIDLMNRGEMGSGHGWTVGWAVAWNCSGKASIIQNPPGCANWAIGCSWERLKRARPFDKEPLLAEGIYDSHGVRVQPESLYMAQLRERFKEKTEKGIGY
ncbi:MAG TPA: hypothetical protein VGP94_11060 [Tepidisphaeraceae bacterium]|nr:hypothetical protein [Tepidisphaeraceae bacterium]